MNGVFEILFFEKNGDEKGLASVKNAKEVCKSFLL